MSQTGIPLKIIWGGVTDDGGIKFILNDTLSKHSIGDIVYKPMAKTGEHEYLLPLDGQTIDGDKYKRLVNYLGSATLPNLNGRYLRADSTPGQMLEAGLPNITGELAMDRVGYNSSNAVYAKGALFSNSATVKLPNNGAGAYETDKDKHPKTFYFDASKSNSIYGKSTTVTPLTYTVRAFICYA